MPEFNVGNIKSWTDLPFGELVEFDVKEGAYTSVRFDVITSAQCSIRAVTASDTWLIASGVGRIGVRMSADEPFAVVVDGPKGATASIRTGKEVQIISASANPTYATAEPRRAGPSDDIKRMMHMVRINTERREKAMADEMRRLRARMDASEAPKPPAVPKDAPAPKPAPEVEAKPDAPSAE